MRSKYSEDYKLKLKAEKTDQKYIKSLCRDLKRYGFVYMPAVQKYRTVIEEKFENAVFSKEGSTYLVILEEEYV